MTLLPPDAVDDVDASALVIEAEMAAAIVNRARAMVQRRIAQLAEDGDAAEADRLRATRPSPSLRSCARSMIGTRPTFRRSLPPGDRG